MSLEPQDRLSNSAESGDPDSLRQPKAILWRALLGGMSAGGLLGALVVLPDGIQSQFASEPDTSYTETWWSWLVITVPIGALVGFMPALLALVVWEWQLPKGTQRARLAGSTTAALAVVATAAVFQLLTAVALVVVAAGVSFAIAYLAVPIITTRRRPLQSN